MGVYSFPFDDDGMQPHPVEEKNTKIIAKGKEEYMEKGRGRCSGIRERKGGKHMFYLL